MTDAAGPARWRLALAARSLLAIDPAGLGGLWLRARHGPLRERWLAGLAPALGWPVRRITPMVADDRLLGGLDIAATLKTGRRAEARGLLAEGPAVLVLAMAERAEPGFAGKLAPWLDAHSGAIVALDEAAEDDAPPPRALTERLAFHVTLDAIAMGEAPDDAPDPAEIADARARLAGVALPEDAGESLTGLAAALGIESLRAPLFALRAARAATALAGRDIAGEDELSLAAALVLAPRLTRLPPAAAEEAEENTAPPPPSSSPDPGDGHGGEERGAEIPADAPPRDVLLEAVRAVLPADIARQLAAMKAMRARGGASSGGARQAGNRRGRPLPSRRGKPGSGARIDLVATLRQAAPWQPMRRAETPGREASVLVRPDDLRIRRYQGLTDRVIVFAVDASGSAAMARLAETKGAIELLLAEAYARRDHVALVAFRGTGAEVLLPPTRSLVQTKRRLAALPGGGPTPLAAGLDAAMRLATAAKARGMAPALAVLTDGRGNIDLSGAADRAAATGDATRIARAIRATGMPVVLVDTGARSRPAARELAQAMGAAYMPLPNADARRLSAAVAGGLDALQ